MLAGAEDRLQSCAVVHRSLQMPEYNTIIDLATYLQRLCKAISCSKLESLGIELSLTLDSVRTSSERCWLLGMIVCELISNTARHAFRGRPGGVHLDLRTMGTSVECRIIDNGVSESEPIPGARPPDRGRAFRGLARHVGRSIWTTGVLRHSRLSAE